MKVINIAIVGIGRIGWPMANGEINKYYSDKYKIVAACDLIEERRNRMANTFGCKTYSDYELGKTRIPVDRLIVLAKYYNVDMNYISGISDKKKTFPKE